jgi:hypothetical protein
VSENGQPTELLPALTAVVAPPPVEQRACPSCGAPRRQGDRFCERCGFDLARPSLNEWVAVIAADRAQWDAVVTDGLEFPSDARPERLTLVAEEIPIGRDAVDGIALAGALEDPGASRTHAALVRLDDGSYTIVDRGSTNGTRLNDDPTPLVAGEPAPVGEGDRIRLGAWTTITIVRGVADDE